jgi:hypothetical protein
MENNFDQLVEGINISPLSTDILHQIILFLKQQTDESLSLVVAQSFQSLLILQHWAWELLTQDSQQWINQPFYLEVLHTLASFIKQIIFKCNTIGDDMKASLVIPDTVEQVSQIFQQIERSTDDNDPFINIASVWFDNHSHFIKENPHCNVSPITDHINQYIAHNYIMSEQYKIHLAQLSQRQLPQSVLTAKMLFYIKTCSFSIFSYMGVRIHSFPYTANELLHCIQDSYVDIIKIHSRTVELWSKELLACMTQLISFTAGLCWWDGENRTHTKLLFPTEQMICDHVQDLIHIIAFKSFQTKIKAARSNDETSLTDATLMLLLTIVQTQNINWFFRSSPPIQNTLLTLAEISAFNEICILAYGILGEFLTDEQLKELKIGDTLGGFFFNMLEQAWHHPSKKYKQIPIEYLLRGKCIIRHCSKMCGVLKDLPFFKINNTFKENCHNKYLLYFTNT